MLHESRRTIVSFRAMTVLVAFAVAALAGYVLLYHECADGGAMASVYRTCTCNGIERVLSDQTAADGPRRSVCLGWVTSRSCYRYREGPQIECVAP
jgi:hypothetical protein